MNKISSIAIKINVNFAQGITKPDFLTIILARIGVKITNTKVSLGSIVFNRTMFLKVSMEFYAFIILDSIY